MASKSFRILKKRYVGFSRFVGRYGLQLGSALLAANVVFNLMTYDQPVKINTARIEDRLRASEEQFDRLADAWFYSPSKDFFVQHLWDILERDEYAALDPRHGVEVYLFGPDSLVFWTTSSTVSTDELRRHIRPGPRLDTVGNAIVVTASRTIGKHAAVLNVRLKRRYPYENLFLRNTYNPYVFDEPNIALENPSSEEGLAIKGTEGEVLFRIRPGINRKVPLVSSILGWAGVFLIALGFLNQMAVLTRKRNRVVYVFAGGAGLILLRWLTYVLNVPVAAGELFQPLFTYGKPFVTSLGNILVNAVLTLMYLGFVYHSRHRIKTFFLRLGPVGKWGAEVAYVLAYVGITVLFHYIKTILIFDSAIQFGLYKILSINLMSMVSYLAVIVLVAVRVMLLYMVFDFFPKRLHIPLIVAINAVMLALVVPINTVSYDMGYLLLVSQIVISVVLIVFRNRHSNTSYYLIISILTLYLTLMIFYANRMNQNANQALLMSYLTKDRDVDAESTLRHFFYDYDFRRPVDSVRTDVERRLMPRLPRYRVGFLVDSAQLDPSRYRQPSDSVRRLRAQMELVGHRIGAQNVPVTMLQDNSGIMVYVVRHPLSPLYITVYVKRDLQNFVLSRITVRDSARQTMFKDYSYARYCKGFLTESSGDYKYDLYFKRRLQPETTSEILQNNYKHLVYTTKNDNVLIVSTPEISTVSIFSLFAYIFLLLTIGEFIILSPTSYPSPFKHVRNRISSKIRLVIVGVIVLSTVCFIFFMLSFYVSREKSLEISNMVRQVEVILNSCNDRRTVLPMDREEAETWTSTSHSVFGLDMIIYDRNGTMLSISDNTICRDGIIGDKMPPRVYENLKYGNIYKIYTSTEFLGTLDFTTITTPIETSGVTRGYMAVPFLKDNSQINQNRYSLIISILNISVMIIVVSMLISAVLYNQIARPLAVVSQAIRNINLRKKIPSKGISDKKDEIGTLIVQYNRMIEELEENYRTISRIERETAWKQMAQQVAHEIKNPLTPMKLKIQMTKRLKDAGDPRWTDRIESLFSSLLDQIDLLARIANEFSSFGRMEDHKPQKIAMGDMLSKLQIFYSNSSAIQVVFVDETDRPLFVYADYDALWRGFVNICSNAIYAIGQKKGGRVLIGLFREGDRAIVTIADNGSGIPDSEKDKIFQPHFTTKKSGSGLGLAITKQTILNYGGDIYFKSQLGEGTTFIILLPLYHEEDANE